MENKISILSTKKLQSNQKNFLLNAGFSLIEADFIQISILPFQIKNKPTLLLFTSQNAVKSVLENHKIDELKQIPSVCVGIKTKQLLEKSGFRVLAMEEYAQRLAPIIQKEFAKEHIAFFAGNIRRNTLPEAMMEKGISFNEYLVYQNEESYVKIEAKTDGLLFFSPSGVKSYLKQNSITTQMCFCIGTTTADALKDITKNVVIANQQTIEELIKLICLTFKIQGSKFSENNLKL